MDMTEFYPVSSCNVEYISFLSAAKARLKRVKSGYFPRELLTRDESGLFL